MRQSFKSIFGYILEIVQVVAISLAIIIPIRYFLFQPFYVKGASMEPNFYDHEYLIIDEISYRFQEPTRGQIIVFRYPNDPDQFFIKRIIGLPGETVEISDGKVKIFNQQYSQGTILDESAYLSVRYTMGEKKIKLGKDQFFVLGDNRSSSLDSRTFGPVPERYIIGRAWVRGWPVNKIGLFEEPNYNI